MSRCSYGNTRHWFAPIVGVRAPFCTRRCGTPNPRPLTADEQDTYEDYLRMVGLTREQYERAHQPGGEQTSDE